MCVSVGGAVARLRPCLCVCVRAGGSVVGDSCVRDSLWKRGAEQARPLESERERGEGEREEEEGRRMDGWRL